MHDNIRSLNIEENKVEIGELNEGDYFVSPQGMYYKIHSIDVESEGTLTAVYWMWQPEANPEMVLDTEEPDESFCFARKSSIRKDTEVYLWKEQSDTEPEEEDTPDEIEVSPGGPFGLDGLEDEAEEDTEEPVEAGGTDDASVPPFADAAPAAPFSKEEEADDSPAEEQQEQVTEDKEEGAVDTPKETIEGPEEPHDVTPAPSFEDAIMRAIEQYGEDGEVSVKGITTTCNRLGVDYSSEKLDEMVADKGWERVSYYVLYEADQPDHSEQTRKQLDALADEYDMSTDELQDLALRTQIPHDNLVAGLREALEQAESAKEVEVDAVEGEELRARLGVDDKAISMKLVVTVDMEQADPGLLALLQHMVLGDINDDEED